MNQELTQRIIGAIVLTALAAIFIPMLFEDPVDNSGQMVSELTIPQEPAITTDDTISKLPRNPEDIAPLPDETAETPDGNTITDMENAAPPMEEQELVGDPNDPELPGEGAGQTDSAMPDEEPAASPLTPPPAANSLDTGEVGEVKKPGKKAPVANHPVIKHPIAKPITKPETPKKPEPAIEHKPEPSKPAKAAGLGRYYLQAGSFSKRENAVSLSEAIRKQGMPVLLDTIQTSRGTMYRLRVGPELDKKRAAAMKSKLQQQNISSILVGE